MIDHLISTSAWGPEVRVECSCGYFEITSFSRAEWRIRLDHQDETRQRHPDEEALLRILEVEASLGGCVRCGHGDHESVDCPFVTEDLLVRDDYGNALDRRRCREMARGRARGVRRL